MSLGGVEGRAVISPRYDVYYRDIYLGGIRQKVIGIYDPETDDVSKSNVIQVIQKWIRGKRTYLKKCWNGLKENEIRQEVILEALKFIPEDDVVLTDGTIISYGDFDILRDPAEFYRDPDKSTFLYRISFNKTKELFPCTVLNPFIIECCFEIIENRHVVKREYFKTQVLDWIERSKLHVPKYMKELDEQEILIDKVETELLKIL